MRCFHGDNGWSVTPFSVEQRHCLHQTDHIVLEKLPQTLGHCVMTEMLQGAAIADWTLTPIRIKAKSIFCLLKDDVLKF